MTPSLLASFLVTVQIPAGIPITDQMQLLWHAAIVEHPQPAPRAFGFKGVPDVRGTHAVSGRYEFLYVLHMLFPPSEDWRVTNENGLIIISRWPLTCPVRPDEVGGESWTLGPDTLQSPQVDWGQGIVRNPRTGKVELYLHGER